MSDLKPTQEQTEILDAAATGQDLVIEAAAGSGKTTTLKMLARQTRQRGLYLAYNRAIKEDAQRSFPPSVDCRTSHGLAYGPVATRYKHRLNGPRVPAQRVAQILRINEPVRVAPDLAPLAPQQLARIAVATVDRFCYSADDEPAAKHVPLYPGLEDRAVRAALAAAVVPIAAKAWADIQDPAGQLRFSHDHYLKMYQLGRPKIRADYLLVDEAQDLNPVVQAIVGYQTDAQVILVGDRCQQLYAWRGAVDAMASFAGERLQLTQSFRFGPAVADEANKWLAILDAGLRVRGFNRVPSVVGPLATPDAVLCRTNGTALGRVMAALDSGRRTALVGGGGEIAKLARAASDLMAGRPCDHPELLAFANWNEVRDYVDQDSTASDLKVFVDLIDKWGPDMLLRVVDRLVDEQRADVVISTGHKSKGREWGSVQIATDFREPKDNEDGTPGVVQREDAMLAYVSVTRAKLQLDREGLSWVDRYLPFNPARPTFGELLEASSLGTPEAVAMRARGRAAAAAELTGMPEEQADWEADADDQDDDAPADRHVHLDDGPFRTLCGLSLDSGVRFTTEPASSDCRACTGTKPDGDVPAEPEPALAGYCYRCGRAAGCTCGPAEAARWSELTGLPAGPKALATVGGRRG